MNRREKRKLIFLTFILTFNCWMFPAKWLQNGKNYYMVLNFLLSHPSHLNEIEKILLIFRKKVIFTIDFFFNSSTLTYDSILEIPINRNLLKTKSFFLVNGAIGYKKYEFQPSRKHFWRIVILCLPKTIIFQGKSNETCVFQHNMLS